MAKTVLMIHGYGCSGSCWSLAAERLRAEGYAVETPTLRADQRKVAAPGAGLAGLSLADYVADMSALAASLAKQDGEAPIVFGHSMGGLIAQKLAEAGLVSAAVLFSPASPADARGKPKLMPLFAFLNAALTPKPETKTVKQWKTGFKLCVMNAVPASRHDALFAQMVHDSGRVLADLAWPDRDPNRTAQVDASKIKVPLLVIAGAQDRTTPVDDLRLVGQKYAAVGGDYVEYPNNAHWLIDEPGTDVILNDLVGWLKTKALSPTPAKAPPAEKAPAKAAAAPEAKPAASPAKAVKPADAPKAAAPKAAPAKAAPKAATATKAVKPAAVAKPTPAKAAPKPAPAAKAGEAKPAAKAAAKPKAAAKAAPAKAPAKVAAPAAKAPAAAPKPAPAAKATTPKAAASKAPAKAAGTKAPPAKAAPAKAAAKPAAATAATKPAATTKAAKSSPKPRKTV